MFLLIQLSEMYGAGRVNVKIVNPQATVPFPRIVFRKFSKNTWGL